MKRSDDLPFDVNYFTRQNNGKKNLNVESKFKFIYETNHWKGNSSLSGQGSDKKQVEKIIDVLPKLIKEYNVKSILDIPCGDFNWMQDVDLSNIQYVGADIVGDIVQTNIANYSALNRSFYKLNLINDFLPRVDLIFCRDCFVHLSNDDIIKSIKNIKLSRSKLLLTTTFTLCNNNVDIVTGDWRILNLNNYPFCFPNPLQIINENCTEGNNTYNDKSLGLWLINDL